MSTGRQSIPSSSNVTPVKYHAQQPIAASLISHPMAQQASNQQQSMAPIAPIGVRPQNYQNGISMPLPSIAPSTIQQQKLGGQRHSPQFLHTAPPPPINSQHFHAALNNNTTQSVIGHQQSQHQQQSQQNSNTTGPTGV